MIRGALAALIMTLSLAGCSSSGGATVVPVDDAFDGMVTDVVRLDLDGGFMPLAVGPDGAVLGIRAVSRGPLSGSRLDLVVVERDGALTLVDADIEQVPLTAALSESRVAWVDHVPESSEGPSIEDGVYRLFTSPRGTPAVSELTDAVQEEGGSVRVYPPALHVLGETIVGAGGESGETLIFAVTGGGEVEAQRLYNAIGLGGIDGCTSPDEVTLLHWQLDSEHSGPSWGMLFTTIDVDGTITSREVDLASQTQSSGHHLAVASCDDTVWHTTRFGEEWFIVGRDASGSGDSQQFPLPIAHPPIALLWAREDYVISNGVASASSILETRNGRVSINVGNSWCNDVAVNSDFIMWRDGRESVDPFDAQPVFSCPIYVGRFAPVES